jgi:hypothetical protein
MVFMREMCAPIRLDVTAHRCSEVVLVRENVKLLIFEYKSTIHPAFHISISLQQNCFIALLLFFLLLPALALAAPSGNLMTFSYLGELKYLTPSIF